MKVIPPSAPENVFPPNREYNYFENCEQHPFRYESRKFQLVNAWWLADASLLSYADDAFAETVLRKAGFTSIQFIQAGATQCFIAASDLFAIAVFRGTQVLKRNEPVSFHEVIQDDLTDIKFSLLDCGYGGCVHRGFKDALDLVWPQVLDGLQRVRQNNPNCSFWFAGHSLGAALATLAADRFGSVQGLYTFGSPRVGDEAFASDFHVNTYRFVNNNDIVARVPTLGPYLLPRVGIAPYQHVGLLKYITADGDIIDNPSFWDRLVDDFKGSFSHVVTTGGNLRSGWVAEIPFDHFVDHTPLFYALKIWNNYAKETGLAAPAANNKGIGYLSALFSH